MSLVIRGGGDFEPAPAGPTAAVCIDVVDLGTQDTKWGARSRLRIVWATAKKMKKNGKPYIVQKTYGRSLHRKSTLRQDLEAWRGRAFRENELSEGFDLEVLIGKPAFLSIQHAQGREGGTFANVVALMPLPKGQPAPIPDPDYVRVKDRDDGHLGTRHGHPEGEDANGDEPPVPDDEDAPAEEEDDDGIPF